jgi:hypothetical protein
MAIVYRHIRLDKNEPFYIGIGAKEERAHTKRGRNRYWKHIVKTTPYEVQILFDDLGWDEACEKEVEFIKLYGRKDLGTGILCNLTDGGDRPPSSKGVKRSDEFKKRLSNSRKGMVFTEEHKKNLSKSHQGFIPNQETRQKLSKAFTGRVLNEDWKKKIAESNTGKKRSDETIEKLKAHHKGNKGLKFSEEHKDKLSQATKLQYQNDPTFNRGENNGFYGKTHSQETKEKMRQAWIIRKQNQINNNKN